MQKSDAFPPLTRHARRRMQMRAMSEEALALTLQFGRIVWTRGAQVFAIGYREVQRFLKEGIDLRPYEGVQVVCSPEGTILTVYRNRDFRRLRPAAGRGRHRPHHLRSHRCRHLE